MGTFVPDKKTSLDADTAARALSDGYKKVEGRKPDVVTLMLLVGQVALETGNFKSIHNYNFGNVRGESPAGLWTSFRASEIVDGKEVFLDVGEKNKFRAYSTAADGAADYIRILKSRPHWWAGLQTKTVEGFVKGLATFPVYMTASPSLYARVLAERANHFAAVAKQYGGTGFKFGVALAAAGVGFGTYYGVSKLRKG